VDHGDGRFVAVCGDPEGQCESVELTLEDVIVHELDVEALANGVCTLLGLEGEFRSLSLAGPVWQLGWYVPISGQRFAVMLILPVSDDEAHNAAVRLRGHQDKPFLLLAPTRAVIDPATVEYLRSGRSKLLLLEEIFGTSPTGDWQLSCLAEDLLRDFRGEVLGDVRFGSPEHRYPTPPGSRWNNVMIRFINGHEVMARVSGHGGGVFNYAHIGMAKANKDEPTVQWDLLHDLAEGHGELPWPRTVARRTVQKQRERLAGHLRDFFGIDGDPFDDLPGRRGFKTRFVVVPEQ
jgi:hypothetical protein